MHRVSFGEAGDTGPADKGRGATKQQQMQLNTHSKVSLDEKKFRWEWPEWSFAPFSRCFGRRV